MTSDEKPKGVLPKAYLRLDPNIDQTHTDPGAMVRLMCAANRQPHRGRFKSRALLDSVLGAKAAKDAIARRDVVEQPDGRFYVPGWDEWQEGDVTVGERQKRIRARRNEGIVTESRWERDNGTGDVTDETSPDRDSPSEALGRKGVETLDVLSDDLLGVRPLRGVEGGDAA